MPSGDSIMPSGDSILGFGPIFKVLRRVDYRTSHLVCSAILAFLAAIFEGLTMVLLIPTLKGLIYRDFTFISETPGLAFLVNEASFNIEPSSHVSLMLALVSLLLISAGVSTMLRFLSKLLIRSSVKTLSISLRTHLFERLLGFGKSYFDQVNLGYPYLVLISYCGQMTGSITVVHNLIQSILTLIVYFAIMVVISWKLAIFVAAVFPIMHFSLSWLIRRMQRDARRHAEIYNRLGKHVSDFLACFSLIKVSATERVELDRFVEVNHETENLLYRLSKKEYAIPAIHDIVILTFIFSIILVSSFTAVNTESMGAASLLVFLFVLKRSSNLFAVLNLFRGSVASLQGACTEIQKMMSDRDKYLFVNGRRSFEGLKSEILMRDVSFSYPRGQTVLNNINLSVERGMMTALVGRSGAGKSTLLQLLLRFYEIDCGNIFIDGVDLREFEMSSWLKRVAFVPQEPVLFDSTLRFNLTYGLSNHVDDSSLMAAVEAACLTDFVNKNSEGLDILIGDRGIRLSGGEKQRVAIARAILREPDLVLLDEPTSSLDARTELKIQQSLESLFKNRTSIVIAHRLSTIRQANQIFVLESGKLVERGTRSELIASQGTFHSLWAAQQF